MGHDLIYPNETKGAGFGWGRETVYGTEVAREADLMFPVKSEDIRAVAPLLQPPDIQNTGNQPAHNRACAFSGLEFAEGTLTSSYHYKGMDAMLASFFGNPTQTIPEVGAYQKAFGDSVLRGPSISGEVYRQKNSLELYGLDVERIALASRTPEPLEIAFGVLARGFEKQTSVPAFAPVGCGLIAVPQDLKVEIDPDGLGYHVVHFNEFSLELVKSLAREMDHQGDSVPAMREPHREGIAEYSGRISRRYGEQDTGEVGREDLYDYFLARQTGTQIKFKFTARGSLITGTTYNLLTIELINPAIQVTGPITDGVAPRDEVIEFRADASNSDVGVKVTTINDDDGTAWASNPLT